jgi:hypothetical protein
LLRCTPFRTWAHPRTLPSFDASPEAPSP